MDHPALAQQHRYATATPKDGFDPALNTRGVPACFMARSGEEPRPGGLRKQPFGALKQGRPVGRG
jgi:hypothetical protein